MGLSRYPVSCCSVTTRGSPQASVISRSLCCVCGSDRFLPDKAIDLVDEAAARLKIQVSSKPIQLDEIDRRLLQLEMEKISIQGDSRERMLDEQEKWRLRSVESQIERLKADQVPKAARHTYTCVCANTCSTRVPDPGFMKDEAPSAEHV